MSNGFIADRPNGIQVVRLLAVRGALRLEKIGLKHSRGSVRKMWAVHFGMKPNTKVDVVMARVEQEIAKLQETGDLGIRSL